MFSGLVSYRPSERAIVRDMSRGYPGFRWSTTPDDRSLARRGSWHLVQGFRAGYGRLCDERGMDDQAHRTDIVNRVNVLIYYVIIR
jgi:hypothetical protein